MINKERFVRGFLYKEYLERLDELREISEGIYKNVVVDDEIRNLVMDRVSKYDKIYIACIAEAHCRDSACNIPVVKRLFEFENVDIRIFMRSLNPDMERELYRRGIKKIPVFVFYNKNFDELFLWIEKPKKADEIIEKWKREHPGFERLKNSDKKDDKLVFKEINRNFLNFLKENYIKFLWRETAIEILSSF